MRMKTIQDIIGKGGDYITGFFVGSFSAIARENKDKLSIVAVVIVRGKGISSKCLTKVGGPHSHRSVVFEVRSSIVFLCTSNPSCGYSFANQSEAFSSTAPV